MLLDFDDIQDVSDEEIEDSAKKAKIGCEDLSKPFKEVLKCPFTRRIVKFSLPCHRLPVNAKVYDGMGDPEDHIGRFVEIGNQGEWPMPDYYHLHEIDSKIEAVMGFPLKCFLDAYKGYHQMSFGLKNAGATYQWLIDEEFQYQIRRNLEAYVDDMVIKSKSEGEMLADIAETFDNLKRINMKLNPKKCSFRVEEGKFLGYMVTYEGIRANPAKTKDLAEMQSPRTWGDMQNITKENKHDYRWTEKAENAFQELKRKILNLPALTTPLPKETLFVYLAASKKFAIKGQILTDSINEMPVDRASNVRGSGAGLVLISPTKTEYTCALRLNFESTNNQAEYEALLVGLRISKKMGVQTLSVNVDSKLVASQINGKYKACKENMIWYLNKAREYISCFKIFKIQNIPRNKNRKADVLSKLAPVAFNHLTKEILVETLDVSSMDVEEINAVVEEEGET
nr:hypothetical protein [Tanacetum cinerariifolium]